MLEELYLSKPLDCGGSGPIRSAEVPLLIFRYDVIPFLPFDNHAFFPFLI